MTSPSILTVQSKAEVATPEASRYLEQLCKHFRHKLPVTFDERSGQIEFSFGECHLDADEDGGVLKLSLSAPSTRQIEELQDVVARHLLRFAFRDSLTVQWRSAA
jgi:uncharacterized protein